MAAAAITMQPEAMGTREVTTNQLLTGRDLDELPPTASVEKALTQAIGPTVVLPLAPVRDVATAPWTVQLHNAPPFPGMSLCALN